MYNCFDTEVAKDVGIGAAVLYKNIQYWCEYNRTNDKNFHDGFHWTFNSAKAFSEQFPYLSEKQIRTALTALEEKGYIKSGNYNAKGYDRTKWYADLHEGNSILPDGQMEFPYGANGISSQGEPIPNINTDNNTNDIPPIIPHEVSEADKMFAEFWAAYPKKVDKKGCERKFKKIKDLASVFPKIIHALEIQKRSKQWSEENGKYIPHPSTWINQERWNNVNEVEERQARIDEIALDGIEDFFK